VLIALTLLPIRVDDTFETRVSMSSGYLSVDNYGPLGHSLNGHVALAKKSGLSNTPAGIPKRDQFDHT